MKLLAQGLLAGKGQSWGVNSIYLIAESMPLTFKVACPWFSHLVPQSWGRYSAVKQ